MLLSPPPTYMRFSLVVGIRPMSWSSWPALTVPMNSPLPSAMRCPTCPQCSAVSR
ncbi:hypothetical protein [Saccharothrix hoggarensis]|uniref:Uncharacterized protein n=1 Tax=Saccharothrix hoggarensis TaxID=913853 RepID=A0ABW3QF74_9PSEU